MRCPESDTCQDDCPHKGEHHEDTNCCVGREWTKLTECPRCVNTAGDMQDKVKEKIERRRVSAILCDYCQFLKQPEKPCLYKYAPGECVHREKFVDALLLRKEK